MNIENEWFLGYAATMQERIFILKDEAPLDNNLTHLLNWRHRKTLLSDSDFNTMLHYKNISDEEFNLGVTPLTELSLKKLFDFVKDQNWFKLHKKVYTISAEFNPTGLETALRFHIKYYLESINTYLLNYDFIKINHSCLSILEECLSTELMSIARRTLVWDIHDIKKRFSINGSDSKEEFQQYLQLRFNSSFHTELFFLEYPTLARLLSERLSYALENFKHIISSIIESADNLAKTFTVSKPFIINHWKSQNGDSHCLGKTTTFIEINGISLVYKYHNNDSLLSFNEFLTCIEEIDPKYYFYKTACISQSNYCFEEFIKNENCSDISEIEQYYKNYGYLIAITYWLGSIDLHMENLIAKKCYPVLIDLETLMRPEEYRVPNDEYAKSHYFEKDSIVTTGLLPTKKKQKQKIDFSALNGTKQKIPFKTRKLVNENTSNIKYQLEEDYLNTAQNIPLLNGAPIPYNDYTSYIIDGYQEMISVLLKNKVKLSQFVNRFFKHTQLRVLLRDTQDYQNFLSFSKHPSCMVNYIEREKIFENIWKSSFINQEIIVHEMDSLLKHDIPYFYTYTESKNIFSLNNTVNDFFNKNILEIFNQHTEDINSDRIHFSTCLLEDSLDSLSADYETIEIPQNNLNISNLYLRKAADIGDLIKDYITIEKNGTAVLWAELVKYNEESFTLEYPDTNLYNGTSGLFIYFHFLEQLIPSDKYEKILYALEYEVFNQPCTNNYYGAFHGYGARLTTAFIVYRFNKDKKYLNYLLDNLRLLSIDIDKYESWEWIYGKSSLLCILTRIYIELDIPLAKDVIETLTIDLDTSNISEIGFAHGYAGIMYSLLQVNSLFHDIRIERKIKELYNSILDGLQFAEDLNPSWCRGTNGINKALHEFSLSYPKYNTHLAVPAIGFTSNNSCLCHGRYSNISDIIDQYKYKNISCEEYETLIANLLQEPVILKSSQYLKPLGLFSGLSGIGYQLLRLFDSSLILNILFL